MSCQLKELARQAPGAKHSRQREQQPQRPSDRHKYARNQEQQEPQWLECREGERMMKDGEAVSTRDCRPQRPW